MSRSTSGFTLVELLIVCAVIVLLAIITGMTYRGYVKQTRDTERQSDIQAIRSALEKYYDKNGEYPDMSNPAMQNCDPMSQSARDSLLTLLPGLAAATMIAPNAKAGTVTSVCTSNAIPSNTTTYRYMTVVYTSTYCKFKIARETIRNDIGSGYYILMYRDESTGLVHFYRSKRGGLTVDPSSTPTPPQTCNFSS